MSHLDDIDFVFWGESPKTWAGLLFLLVVAAAAISWAVASDMRAADVCGRAGERYVDSRSGYTLCEQDGGTVVRR